jgi:hypothetical protein
VLVTWWRYGCSCRLQASTGVWFRAVLIPETAARTCQGLPLSIPTVNPLSILTVNPLSIPTVNPLSIPTVNPLSIPTVNPLQSWLSQSMQAGGSLMAGYLCHTAVPGTVADARHQYMGHTPALVAALQRFCDKFHDHNLVGGACQLPYCGVAASTLPFIVMYEQVTLQQASSSCRFWFWDLVG